MLLFSNPQLSEISPGRQRQFPLALELFSIQLEFETIGSCRPGFLRIHSQVKAALTPHLGADFRPSVS
jgi:hypothetical protein